LSAMSPDMTATTLSRTTGPLPVSQTGIFERGRSGSGPLMPNAHPEYRSKTTNGRCMLPFRSKIGRRHQPVTRFLCVAARCPGSACKDLGFAGTPWHGRRRPFAVDDAETRDERVLATRIVRAPHTERARDLAGLGRALAQIGRASCRVR